LYFSGFTLLLKPTKIKAVVFLSSYAQVTLKKTDEAFFGYGVFLL